MQSDIPVLRSAANLERQNSKGELNPSDRGAVLCVSNPGASASSSVNWCDLALQIQKGKGVKHMPGLGPAVPQQCPETGANFLMGGPFWADPIHNMEWVNGILKHVQVSLCCTHAQHHSALPVQIHLFW